MKYTLVRVAMEFFKIKKKEKKYFVWERKGNEKLCVAKNYENQCTSAQNLYRTNIV